jgi:hypothetical protein
MVSKRLIKQEIRASFEKYFFSKQRRMKNIARKPCKLMVPIEGKPLIQPVVWDKNPERPRKLRKVRIHLPRLVKLIYPLTSFERCELDDFFAETGWIDGQWFRKHCSLVIQTRYDLGVRLDEFQNRSVDPIRLLRGVAFSANSSILFNCRPPEVPIKIRERARRRLSKMMNVGQGPVLPQQHFQAYRRRRRFWVRLAGSNKRSKKYARGLRLNPTLYGLL